MKLCICLITLSLFCLASVNSEHKIESFKITGNPERVEDFVFKGKESKFKGHKLQIANGRQASNNQFPFVAELSINTATGGYRCTGSLIAPNWVLTARHCIVELLPVTSILASFGSADRSAVRTQIYVDSATWLNSATGVNNPDIALFHLQSSPPLNTAAIKTVRLPKLSAENFGYDNYDFTAIGWGQISLGVFSQYLQYTTFRIIPQTTCNMQTLAPSLGPYVLCSKPPTGTSQLLGGDSGGPGVIVEADGIETQIAVNVAYVTTSTNVYQASTRVSSYLRWIQQTTGVAYV